MLWCGPLILGKGLPPFGVACCVGVQASHASVWFLQMGVRTSPLRCGPFISGEGLPRFRVAILVGVKEAQALVWPLALEMTIATL